MSPVGRQLELESDLLVGCKRRVSPMPGAAIGIPRGIDGLGQCPMHGSTPLGGRSCVDRGPEQWVAERDSRSDIDEVGLFRGSGGVGRKTQQGGGPPEKHWIAGRFGCTEEQQALRVSW